MVVPGALIVVSGCLKIHLGRTQVLEYGQTTSENSPLEVNMFVGVPQVKIESAT
jgi:hypothetical protein